MRSKLSRIALALALAVPIQGMATAMARLCMALGHHDAAVAASHDHATGSGAHHAHGDASVADDNSPGGAHCPPCIACCAAAAISSFPRIFLAEPPAMSVIAAPGLSFSGIPPERLDRPPLAL
jgi:hypothetical protein